MARTYRNHRGVKIYRVKRMICGSDFDVKDDGSVVDKRPQHDVYYRYADGPLFDTVDECKISIDGMINVAERFDGVADMVETLNVGDTE